MTSTKNTLVSIFGRMVFAAGVTLSVLHQAHAATISANSVSFADVTSAVALAMDGDTVVVPAGTASWTSLLAVTKGITLQGAGNDTTVILDNVPRDTVNQGGSTIALSSALSQSFRLTGFTFRYGSLVTSGSGTVRLSGMCPSVRVDHCHFDQVYAGSNIAIYGWLYGVIDHCTFDMRAGGNNSVSVTHQNWGGPDMAHPIYTDTHGHGSWADPPYFGSEKFIFVEDNIINNLGTGPNNGTIDGSRGGRFVVRHNTFNNCAIFYHGSDSGAGGVNYRGTRCVEIYNNVFNSSITMSGGENRGGSLLWHDNTYNGAMTGGMSMKTYRLFQQPPIVAGQWGVANGNNPWDYNVTESDGVTHIDGRSPYLFLAGNHTGGNNSSTLVVANAGWAPDRWAGYSATNTRTGYACYIASNTSDTITFATNNSNADSVVKFNTGDGFQIYKILVASDQPCRGRGDLLTGDQPTPRWLHQALEPCYSWNNSLNGSNRDFNHDNVNDPLRENVDFYNNTPMPGYTPYVYPHPLVSGIPSAPTNLRVL
jgi:hypothetical protein